MALKFLLRRQFASRDVKFRAITSVYQQIDQTSSRNQKIVLYKDYLRQLTSDEEALRDFVRVSMGLFQPRYNEDFEINIAESMIEQSLSYSFMVDKLYIKGLLKQTGDHGDAAAKLFQDYHKTNTKEEGIVKENRDLTLEDVVTSINILNDQIGADSTQKKIDIIDKLIKQCGDSNELKFIVRSLNSGLRIGLSKKSIETCLVTLAMEGLLSDKMIKEFEKNVFGYMISSDKQNESSNKQPVTFNIPIRLMLGRPAKDPDDVLKQLKKYLDDGKMVVEYKYDGERTQIHFDGTQVNLFSRNFESQNQKFWYLREKLQEYFEFQQKEEKIKNCILDGEIVYIGPDGKYLPFQEIERKLKETEGAIKDKKELPAVLQTKLPCVVLFDLLAINDQNTCKMNIIDRKATLERSVEPTSFLQSSLYKVLPPNEHATQEIQSMVLEAVNKQCEGLVIKAAHPDMTFYDTSGKRTGQWMKLKSKGLVGNNMRDTLDLVPIGAFYGKGNRTGRFGSFLMAAYSAEEGCFQSICKLGTGFSQSDQKRLSEELEQCVLPEQPHSYVVSSSHKPDVWLEPKFVWEVGADCFTQSKFYSLGKSSIAAMTGKHVGLSLRFPRFIRERDDKRVMMKLADFKKGQTPQAMREVGTEAEEIITMYLQDYK